MKLTDLYFSWWLRPGTNETLRVDGLERSYIVHVPNGKKANGENQQQSRMPLVLALHGATMNGAIMASFCGLNRKADQEGFIVVYPNGTGENSTFFWNAGNPGLAQKNGTGMHTSVDDVAFIDALLDELMRAYPVDPNRVYVTGMSNGGVMAYRLATELSYRVAAIAPVAGVMVAEIVATQRSVSVLHFHGTKDEYIPFQGGIGKKSVTGTNYRSVEDCIQIWVKANGCSQIAVSELLSEERDLKVHRKTYGGGKEGSEVSLVQIEGGGHTWPGRRSPANILGKSTTQVSANDLMWEFFLRHPLNP